VTRAASNALVALSLPPHDPESRVVLADPNAALVRWRIRGAALMGAALVAILAILGPVVAAAITPTLHSPMLPWVLGRGLGLASFFSLSILTITGLLVRHPWRGRWGFPRPSSTLRIHAALAATTVSLVIGHLTALALDHFANVGWGGAFIPWMSVYRPTPVALGTLALWGMVLIGGSASLAGRFGGRHWLPIHHLSMLVFAATWLHGVTAGSDTMALRLIYGIAGGIVVALWATARFPQLSQTRREAS